MLYLKFFLWLALIKLLLFSKIRTVMKNLFDTQNLSNYQPVKVFSYKNDLPAVSQQKLLEFTVFCSLVAVRSSRKHQQMALNLGTICYICLAL